MCRRSSVVEHRHGKAGVSGSSPDDGSIIQKVFVGKVKKLYRSTSDRKIAGVCGGLAEYFGIDSVIVRLIFFVLLLPGGAPGFLPYLLLWIIVPEKPTKS